MSLKMGLLGRKIGMTQVFHEDGTALGVTAVSVGPCVVVGKRTPDKHGYSAVQLGFEEKPLRLVSRPEAGFFKKASIEKPLAPPARGARSRPKDVEKYEVGKVLRAAEVFKVGDVVDVVGTTKGKGYQGVMKRHKMAGDTHDPRYPRVLPSRRLDRLPPHPGPRPQGQAHVGPDGQRQEHRRPTWSWSRSSTTRTSCWSRAPSPAPPTASSCSRAASRT